MAPGVSIVSLRNPGSYADTNYSSAAVNDRLFRGTGTSQAAAVVAGAAAVIIIFASLVMVIGFVSIIFAHPRITGSAHPTNVEPYDPMTITTSSSTLNRPIRLRYIPEDMEATRPIQIIATPVVPGKAGPAQEPPPGPSGG